jgi:hypothetical protein
VSEQITIDDEVFDQLVTLREAYRIMERFLSEHFHRGEQPTGVLLGYLSLWEDGTTGDPAALHDYLDAVALVVGRSSGTRG